MPLDQRTVPAIPHLVKVIYYALLVFVLLAGTSIAVGWPVKRQWERPEAWGTLVFAATVLFVVYGWLLLSRSL